jgi:hypothetical protein
MATVPYEDDEDDARRRGRIMRDGEVVRVPMMMRDSKDAWRDEMAKTGFRRSYAKLDDAAKRLGLTDHLDLCRPGFRYCTDAAARDAKEAAYRAYDEEQTNAWRKSGTGSIPFVGQRAGDLCTINGRAGHLQMVDGELQCVPNEHADALPLMDVQTAYALTDWEAENAWRGREWLAANRPKHFPRGR